MKVKKKLFKSIKGTYIADMQYSKRKENEYKKYLENYEPKFGSKHVLFERYAYYKTVAEKYARFLKDLERMEGHI